MTRDSKHKDDNHPLPKQWVGCSIEEEYLGHDRKSSKSERKIATAKDRSKYKKTDQDKLQAQAKALAKNPVPPKEDQIRGRVLAITPQGITVQYEEGTIVCALRGLLKKEKTQYKNLVVVGDFVYFSKQGSDEGTISSVEPRKTVLSRADNLSRRKEQLIAANIDQVMITVSVMAPPLKPAIVDRYIIATRKGGMQPIILVNKIDLLQDDAQDEALLEQQKEMYEAFLEAYGPQETVIAISASTGEGMEELQAVMKDKASVFSGQSGVGKSSLINTITGLDLKVGQIVEKTQKGAHTTTTASLIPLSFGGWCIDTPGIKSFGVWDLKKEDILPYFSEIHMGGEKCKYPNCTHTNEPECAVLKLVESGEISWLRYQSYVVLMDSVGREHVRR